MTATDWFALKLLRTLNAELSHDLALKALSHGLSPRRELPTSARLICRIAGLDMPNPIGLAAGLDKNAVALPALLRSGFGFVEVGAVTPRPQPGNPRPRLFRLSKDRAIINRMGFNNEGADIVARRLERPRPTGIVGINLGANKDSEDRAKDFAEVLTRTGAFVDYATINVSSPNTERLRDLQGRDALRAVIERVQSANEALHRPVPLFVKVAPDLDAASIDEICEVVLATKLPGLIATNTTLSRPNVTSKHEGEPGGLSGAPLRDLAAHVLAQFAERLEGKVALIGAGGIGCGSDAQARFDAGANAIQIYSALIYEGFGLVTDIAEHLDSPHGQ